MRTVAKMSVLIAAGAALGGCSQITVTSNTLLDGTARIADATTNAVEGTSAVTTNTANDVDSRSHQARLSFVDSQMQMLRREAARGEGENLETLAYMMRNDDTRAFERQVQANYSSLFDRNADADEWLARLYDVLGTPSDMTVAAAE